MNDSAFMPLPEPPSINEERLKNFNDRGEWIELFYEWTRFCVDICVYSSCISYKEYSIKRFISQNDFVLLCAIMSRTASLCSAIMCITQNDKHGDAAFILKRSVIESCCRLLWLLDIVDFDKRITVYKSDSLRNDLLFRKTIDYNIANRKYELVIERRMKNSIKNKLYASGLEEHEIMAAKKMPNYEQILNQLGLSETFYSASQRMSSHFVHCSYTSLFNDIISHDNNRNLSLKQYIESLPHVNNYSPMIYIIINTTNEFFNFVFDENEVDVFNQWMSKVKEKLESHKSYLHGDDFSAV